MSKIESQWSRDLHFSDGQWGLYSHIKSCMPMSNERGEIVLGNKGDQLGWGEGESQEELGWKCRENVQHTTRTITRSYVHGKGAGEMAQLLKSWLCIHEDWSSDPEHLCRKWWRQGQANSWSSRACHSGWIGELWVLWESLSQRIRWREIEGDIWCWPLASSTYGHLYIHMYM